MPASLAIMLLAAQGGLAPQPSEPERVYVFPYFQGNGESGLHLALSENGLRFEPVNDNRPVLNAPDWPGENLVRDPSVLYRDGTFHLVWTTGWETRTIGYASSADLVAWSEPRRIPMWPEDARVRNTWAPELHFDESAGEFLILWSSTTLDELEDGDGSTDPHGHDHRIYASRTGDFARFTPPELFYAPQPEHGVIDAFIATDGAEQASGSCFVMVIKNEMGPERGGKNLRLAFADRMRGPYSPVLGPPIVGAGTPIVDRMAEGPSLVHVDGQWRLYFDAPGGPHAYCLATSPDLIEWTDRSSEVAVPGAAPRHGTIFIAPAPAVGWLRSGGAAP